MRRDHRGIFLWSFGVCFIATSAYPLTLLIFARNNFLYYMGIDVAWSIYVWFFIPLGAGVILILTTELFRSWIPAKQRGFYAMVLLIFAGLIGWGAWRDNARLPASHTIEAVNGAPVGEYAIKVDRCLRDVSECADFGLNQASLLSQVDHCASTNPQALTKLLGAAQPSDDIKLYAFYCALINDVGNHNAVSASRPIDISLNGLAEVSWLLKWLVYDFVLLFLFCLSYNSSAWFRVDVETLTGLIAAWSILVMWFPFRLYSDWQIWYQDSSHFFTRDTPVSISLGFAFISLGVIIIDFLVTLGRLDPRKTAIGVWGALGAVFTAFSYWNPEKIVMLFRIINSMDIGLVVPGIALLFGMVALHIYVLVVSPNPSVSSSSGRSDESV